MGGTNATLYDHHLPHWNTVGYAITVADKTLALRTTFKTLRGGERKRKEMEKGEISEGCR